MEKIYNDLLQLEEWREQAILAMNKRQETIKKYFDKSTNSKDFQKDQFILLWNKEKEKPSFHTKFESLWIGPYQIKKLIGYNSYLLKYMKGIIQPFPVNEKHLEKKLCLPPLVKICIYSFSVLLIHIFSFFLFFCYFLLTPFFPMEEDSRFSATHRGNCPVVGAKC
jgi:hypothetical protein